MRAIGFSALALMATVSMAAAQTAEGQPAVAAAEIEASGSSEAVQNCRQSLHNIETRSKLAEMQQPTIPRQDLRKIREAALAFARADYQEGCEEVAEALENLLEEREDEIERKLEKQQVESAQPVSQLPGSVMASTLVGSQVINQDLEDLGTVEDLILTENQGRYALIKHGGFLGLGEDFTPIGLDRLRITEDRDYLVLDISEDALDEAPEVSEDEIDDVGTWSQQVDEWWTANAGQATRQQ